MSDIKELKLNQICRPTQWKTISTSELEDEGYPVYGANGIIGHYHAYNHEHPVVMITCRGATCGTVNISQPFSYITGNAMCLDDLDTSICDQKYLFYNLRIRGFSGVISGSAQPQITRQSLDKITIPLPPLEEQKRIAGILDKADAIRRKRAESLKLLDELLRATFLDMFGTRENKGWNETIVGKTIDDKSGAIRTGPFGSQLLHSEFVSEGIAVLGIDNAVHNEFRWAKPRFISLEKYQQLKRYTVRSGDVLITIMGTCGRCAIVPSGCPTAINTKHLCCITLNQGVCLPEFLHSFFLLHPKAKCYLKQTAKGAIMDGLNMAIIKAMPIVLPPIGLQQKYQAFWHKIQKSKQKLTLHESESDTLFHSLVARAFKGEL